MEIVDSFIPTAGVVGLLPMVTYFFLVVALFAFLGLFVFSLAIQLPQSDVEVRSNHRLVFLPTSIIAAVAGLAYYTIQSYYHDVLAEFVTVSDVNDRQTLIRESYNALSQFRYMALFIITPLLFLQLRLLLPIRPDKHKKPFVRLLLGSSLLVFTMYIGHQQLSFGNDVQVGPLITWGLIALAEFGFLSFTFHQLWKDTGEETPPPFNLAVRILAVVWVVYFIGYFLTLTTIDCNWIQIAFIMADLASMIGIGVLIYLANTNRLPLAR